MPVPIVPPAPGWFSMMTGCPQYSDSFWPNVRARMSVALPAVKGTMILTGFVGHVCAPANDVQSAHSATTPTRAIFIRSSSNPSTQSVADRHVLRHQLHTSRFAFQHEQLREIFFGHPAADQRLHDV